MGRKNRKQERTEERKERESKKGRNWANLKQLGVLKLGWTFRVALLRQRGKALCPYVEKLLGTDGPNKGA